MRKIFQLTLVLAAITFTSTAVANTDEELVLKCAKDDESGWVFWNRHDDNSRRAVLNCLGYTQHRIRRGDVDRKTCLWSLGNKQKRDKCKLYNNSFDSVMSVIEFDDAITKARNRQYLKGKQFKGSKCTSDCSGHKAGYDWAQSENIADISECQSQSPSFSKGCEIYVSEY